MSRLPRQDRFRSLVCGGLRAATKVKVVTMQSEGESEFNHSVIWTVFVLSQGNTGNPPFDTLITQHNALTNLSFKGSNLMINLKPFGIAF